MRNDSIAEVMATRSQHAARVDAWLARTEATPTARVGQLSRALAALWLRAHVTLDALTLCAAARRALEAAAATQPPLVTVDRAGFRVAEPPAGSHDVASAEADAAALRAVAIEFVTVLGAMTSEVLTPALYEALAEVSRAAPPRVLSVARGASPAAACAPPQDGGAR